MVDRIEHGEQLPGAGAVFELAALGKPSILVPYPFAANLHQEANAGVLVKAGGAEVMLQDTLSGRALAERITYYMENSGVLEGMAEAARGVAKPDAAVDITTLLLEMIRS